MTTVNISTGLTACMTSLGIGIVPVRMNGIDLIWGPPESGQERILPLLGTDETAVRSMFESDGSPANSKSLFTNYQRLRVMIGEASTDSKQLLAFVREKAERYDKANSHDAAAMLYELALDMEGRRDVSDAAYLMARTDVARAWLVSLREYSEPVSDRLRVSRGLMYGWPEKFESVYRPLLRDSMDIYTGSKQRFEAASDQLRIALALSLEDSLDADAYSIISDMLKSAATMLADSWEKGIDTALLQNLADEASRLSEGE